MWVSGGNGGGIPLMKCVYVRDGSGRGIGEIHGILLRWERK